MSVNSLLYPNFQNLYAGTLNLKGKTPGGVEIAPMVVGSSVLVANLYAARALVSDASFGGNVVADTLTLTGNASVANLTVSGTIVSTGTVSGSQLISTTTALPPLIIHSTSVVGNLYAENAMHSDDTNALNSATTVINVSNATAPTVGQALIATSNVAATWQTISVTPGSSFSGNVVSANIVNSPVITSTTINATTVNASTFNGNLVATTVNTGSLVATGNVDADIINANTVHTGSLTVTSNAQVTNLNAEFSGTADVALALKSATTVVNVSAAAAPTVGQALVATSGTAATWQAIPAASSAAALDSATTVVDVSASAAPTVGQVLVATSDSAATWQTLASSNAFTYSTTATAAGTTTLTTSASYYNFWTGSTTQTVKLPGAGTSTGNTYVFKNLSSGNVTLQAADASALVVLATNDVVKYCCITADAPTNAAWSQVI